MPARAQFSVGDSGCPRAEDHLRDDGHLVSVGRGQRATGTAARQYRSDAEESVSSPREQQRSEEHTSELQSLMRISYAVFCLKKKKSMLATTYTTEHTIRTFVKQRQ